MSPRLVLAAGGTGGHMFPAQALAEEMLARGWRVTLATDARGLRYAGGFAEAVERVEIRAARAGGGLTARLALPVTLIRSVAAAIGLLRRARPAAVAGFGGYPAFPLLAAAWGLGVPRVIHEQNAVLGRVNRLFARRVDRVACGLWPVTGAPEGAALEHVGNPVRRAVLDAARVPFDAPGDGPVRLLVFGGSQGAAALAKAVPRAVELLPEAVRARLRVTQQVREGEEGPVAEAYRSAGVAAERAPFFDDLPDRIAAAQAVIARAGASTVAELAAIGRPAILVPYPHAAADHQTANARALAEAGGAVVAPEPLTAEALARHIRALLEPETAGRMAAAARATARPDAARRLATLVETVAAPRLGTARAAC